MANIKVGLRPIIKGVNLPTVLKTAIFPGDSGERLFITTQEDLLTLAGEDGKVIFQQ